MIAAPVQCDVDGVPKGSHYITVSTIKDALAGQFCCPDGRLAVEHRPADVVPQMLVVEYELADRLRELVTLPPALKSPCALALSFRRGGTCGLDRVGGRTELVRRDVCDGRGLAGSVRGMPCCPTQVSGRGHCMAGRRASLGHGDLASRPGPPEFDRAMWPRVLRLSRDRKSTRLNSSHRTISYAVFCLKKKKNTEPTPKIKKTKKKKKSMLE